MKNEFDNDLLNTLTAMIAQKENAKVTPVAVDDLVKDVFTMTYTDKETNKSDIICVKRTPFDDNDLGEYFEDGEYTINITIPCFPYDVNIYTNLGIYKIRRMRLN